MPQLALTDAAAANVTADALIVGVAKGPDGPTLAAGAESLDQAMQGRLLAALIALGATGAEAEVTRLATLGSVDVPVIAAAGIGERGADGRYRVESIRRAAGAATRDLAGKSVVATTLGLVNGDGSGADEVTLRAAGEGALLGAYEFGRYRTSSSDSRKPPVGTVLLVVNGADRQVAESVKRRSQVVMEAVHLARDLINTPPNHLPPAEFAVAAQQAAEKAGVAAEVLDESALRAGGFGGILAVGTGSANPPRLVHLSYRGPEARTSIALVGKGITFDSGGLSLKPATSMPDMKADMSGAAAVVAAVCAAAELRLPVALEAWVPMAENMPGGSAYRPSDVVTMYSGRRVEVLNTDAEGRMILADAIARASEDNPDYLVETSTLTGAQRIALGSRTAAVMGDPELCRRVQAAGERSGEAVWPMPLPEDVRRGMDSAIADISQVNATLDRAGGMLQAGLFLAEFVPDAIPFAHIDIAGPAYNSGSPHGYTPKGATGVPIRTLVELIEDLAQSG